MVNFTGIWSGRVASMLVKAGPRVNLSSRRANQDDNSTSYNVCALGFAATPGVYKLYAGA
eukprot:1357679-Lingulodinium_polyedra.AAC.1